MGKGMPEPAEDPTSASMIVVMGMIVAVAPAVIVAAFVSLGGRAS